MTEHSARSDDAVSFVLSLSKPFVLSLSQPFVLSLSQPFVLSLSKDASLAPNEFMPF